MPRGRWRRAMGINMCTTPRDIRWRCRTSQRQKQRLRRFWYDLSKWAPTSYLNILNLTSNNYFTWGGQNPGSLVLTLLDLCFNPNPPQCASSPPLSPHPHFHNNYCPPFWVVSPLETRRIYTVPTNRCIVTNSPLRSWVVPPGKIQPPIR